MRSVKRIDRGDQVYIVDVDETSRMVTGARVHIAAHDKKPTWRRVNNVRTLEILGEMIFGSSCPCCGASKHPSI